MANDIRPYEGRVSLVLGEGIYAIAVPPFDGAFIVKEDEKPIEGGPLKKDQAVTIWLRRHSSIVQRVVKVSAGAEET